MHGNGRKLNRSDCLDTMACQKGLGDAKDKQCEKKKYKMKKCEIRTVAQKTVPMFGHFVMFRL